MNWFAIFLGLAAGLMFEPNVDVPWKFTFDETDQSGRFVVHEKGGQPMVVYVKNEVDPVSCFRSVPILSESWTERCSLGFWESYTASWEWPA